MKRSRFSEGQIIDIFKQAEAGTKVADLCRQNGISDARSKYGGLEISEAKRLRRPEEGNSRLKKLVADLMFDNAMLKDVASKNFFRTNQSANP